MRLDPRGLRERNRAERFAATITAATILLLMAPTAAALEQASGTITVRGIVSFSDVSAATYNEVLAFVAPSLVPGSSLAIEVASANVCHITKTFIVADGGVNRVEIENGPAKTEDCADLHNVVIDSTLSSDSKGYVGVYPDSMEGSLKSTPDTTFEPRLTTHLASQEASTTQQETDPRGIVTYWRDVRSPHVLISTTGEIAGTFSGQLKVRGLNLHVKSDDGERTYTTGSEEPKGPFGERNVSFVFLTLNDARYTLTSPVPFLLASRAAEVNVDGGTLSFTALGGSIVSDDARYEPRPGARERIEGTLTATLTPKNSREEGTLALDGSIAATTLTRAPVPRPPIQAELPEWAFIVLPVAGTVLVGGGGLLLFANRNRLYLRFAHRAMKMANLAEAVEWVERACGADPTDYDSAMWAAILHRRLGDIRRARVLMERASRVAPRREGRPDYYLAVLGLEPAGPDDLEPDVARQQAIIHLEHALARAPSLVHEIRRDRALDILRGPEFEGMIRDALARAEAVTAS